jgi:effector-binding domain-containing protein
VVYEVRVERAEARQLAAVRGSVASHDQLGPRIISLLDNVWPLLRAQGVRTGHNVVVYFGGSPLQLAAGVEVFEPFRGTDVVEPLSTPAGEVATTVHWGDYAQMRGAYAALERWCATNQRKPAGISWEVYGDWYDDPAQVRTDIYFLLAAIPSGA